MLGLLVAPEVKADVELAAFVEDPAEEGAEYGKQDGSGDRPRIIADHQPRNNIPDAEKYRGVQENGEDAEGQYIERECEK